MYGTCNNDNSDKYQTVDIPPIQPSWDHKNKYFHITYNNNNNI